MARTKHGGRSTTIPYHWQPQPSRHQRDLLAAFEQSTRCAPVQPATMLCGRVYWLEGIDRGCRSCQRSGTARCETCGWEPHTCTICGSDQDLVRDPQTNAVLCERDVLRETAVQALLVCSAYGVHAESLKQAVLQAVFGAVPLEHMSRKKSDDGMGEGNDDRDGH